MKNVKKLLALAAVSAVFCCTAVFTACATTEHECTYGDWEETTPATCTQEGVETRVCADNPEHKQTRKTDPLGHDWGDWELTTSVSCTEAGEETRTCKRDKSHTEKHTSGEATGHKWDDGEVTATADCINAGEKTFTCTVEGCGETKKETVSALGHKWDDGEVTTPAECTTDGKKTFTCTVEDCEAFKIETIGAAGHKLTHEDAEPAGCTEDGTLEHWECSVCEKKFSDEEGTIEVADADLADPAAHKLAHVDAEPAGCTEDGTLEHYKCSVCGKKFSDEKGTTEVTDAQLADPAGHKLTPKQTTDCSGTVTVDYFNCTVCGKNFEDKDAKKELSLAELTKHSLTHVDADPASCTENGTLEYWECSDCGKKFGDEHGADAVTDADLVDPAAHKLSHVDADPAGCTEDGTLEHYECSVCEKKFSDENGENEVTDADLVDPAAHKLTHVDADPATCTEDGTLEHYECSVCEKKFSDENGENEVAEADLADPATGHVSLTHHEEEASTCTKAGYEEYWECDACHQLFDDEQGQTELDAPFELPLADHTYDSIFSQEGEKAATCTADGYRAHNVCTVCKTKFALNDTNLVTPLTEEEWAANYVLPAKHTSVTKRAVKDATCTAIGYSTEHYYCSKCKSYAMDANFTQPITAAEAAAFEIGKLGHDYSEEWTIDTQPTCANAGSKSHHCSRCSSKTDTTAIDALPHTWDETDYVVDLEPTCSSAGSKSYHCSVCGGKDEARAVEIPVDPEAHQWSTRKFILTPANCVSAGTQANRCLICGENQEVSVLDVNPSLHNYSKLWTVESEPTCTTAGLKYHVCLNEGCEVKGDVTEIPFLKHNYVCDTDGTATCTNGCNDTKSSPASVAGKTVNNFVEITQKNEHFNTKLGVNLVSPGESAPATSLTHYLDFYAEKTDTYVFTFEYFVENIALVLSKLSHDTDGGSANLATNGKATVTKIGSSSRAPIESIEIAMIEGETLYIYLNWGSTSTTPNYIMKAEMKEVSTANALTYGDNTVNVTVADDSTGTDSYTFVPTESKKYSITVPAGLGVAMGNDDITGGATYAEFNATKGVAITFSFSHSVVGEYEINIGEASAKVLELNAAASSVTIVGHEMTEYHVADDLAPGKYTITFTGNFTVSKAGGAGKLWFQLNGSSNFDDLSNDTALYLESFANINKEGYVCNLAYNTWTVTLELAAGDIIYLAPDASLTAGAKTTATLNIQLTKAA